jgi:hypothetical protein
MIAILRISLYSYPYLSQQKFFAFLVIAYVYFSTKLEKMDDQVPPGSNGHGGEREEAGVWGRNGPNNVCTYE